MTKWNLIESTYSVQAIVVASLIQPREYENSTFYFIFSFMLTTRLQKEPLPFVMWQTFPVNSSEVDIGLFKIRCTLDGHSLSNWISYSSLIKLSDNLSIVYSKSACFYLVLSMFACQISILMYLATNHAFSSFS